MAMPGEVPQRKRLEPDAAAGVLDLPRSFLARTTPDPATAGRLRRLAEPGPALLWTTDHDLRFTSGPAPRDEGPLPGGSVVDFYGAADWEAPPVKAHRRALAGESAEFEHRWQGRLLRCHVEPLRDAFGRVSGTIGVAFDMTERRAAEEELYRENELAGETLAAIGDGVIRADLEGIVDYLNPVAERLTGWSSIEAVGRPVGEVFSLFDEVTRRPLAGPVERCLAENRLIESPPHAVLVRADGMEYSVRDSAAPIRDREGRLVGAVLVFKDVTQLRGMEREMVYLASHDALTGLINRREFEARLKRALRSALGERRLHAMLYLDLDEFKVVNDTCGHLAGDELLKQVTALLRSRVRRIDSLARLGGDEFGVLLEDCPLVQARQIAEELRGTVREFRFRWKDQVFEIGVSIGLVPIDATSGDLASLLSAADAACYVAKEGGRNRVHEYEMDDTLVAERHGEMQWIHRIHRAFEDRLFRLYYQPIQPLGAAGERETLCEVLIRMLDDRGRVLSPAAFISAAERYHLIGAVDRWVVRTALRALAEAQRRRRLEAPALRHQPLRPVALGRDLPRLRRRPARRERRRLAPHLLRDHRDRRRQQARRRHPLHQGAQGDGLPLRARRLRQRPVVVRLPARPAGRLPEDRRRVRQEHGRGPGQAGAGRVDQPDRPRHRRADDRRVGGEPRHARRAQGDRRRLRPGLLDRQAAALSARSVAVTP